MLLRGLFGRCPVCGSGDQFHRWFRMSDRCPHCDLLYERVDGHWIGAIGVNTVAVMGLILVVLFGTSLATFPDSPPVAPMIGVLVTIALLGPLVFFPSSRMLWTAIDLLMRPLKPGEVDPRYVVVDPQRDRPTGN
jgi:uncharacterized protein (DUF983 family)